MIVENPLLMLAAYGKTSAGLVSLSFQKISNQGAQSENITTFDLSNVEDIKATAKAILKTINKRQIMHHGQPEIESILREIIVSAGYADLNNRFLCTQDLLEGKESCRYNTDVRSLARREGAPQSAVDLSHHDSHSLCEIYLIIYERYIKHVYDDIFAEDDSNQYDWSFNLTVGERAILRRSGLLECAPDGWSLTEAQAAVLFLEQGQSVKELATLTGRSEIDIDSLAKRIE